MANFVDRAVQIRLMLSNPNVLGEDKDSVYATKKSYLFVFFGNYAENDYLCTVKSRVDGEGD